MIRTVQFQWNFPAFPPNSTELVTEQPCHFFFLFFPFFNELPGNYNISLETRSKRMKHVTDQPGNGQMALACINIFFTVIIRDPSDLLGAAGTKKKKGKRKSITSSTNNHIIPKNVHDFQWAFSASTFRRNNSCFVSSDIGSDRK